MIEILSSVLIAYLSRHVLLDMATPDSLSVPLSSIKASVCR
jgi:hypothetical protein